MTSFILTSTHITLVFENGESITVYNQDANYDTIVAEVKSKNWEEVYRLAFADKLAKEKSIESLGDGVYLKHGMVYYKGDALHGTLADRMIEMHSNGFDLEPMSIFLKNLMENPSFRSINELYDFLEASNLPITEDGHFLAYKRVDENFKDLRSGTYNNSPGTVVKMTRGAVNDDKDKTCAEGLHFCSRKYLPHFYANKKDSRVVMLKINPRDVVSIPSDYDNAKGRCCEYTVIRELDITTNDDDLERAIWLNLENEYDYDDNDNDDDLEGLDTWDNVESLLNAIARSNDTPSPNVRAVEQLNLISMLRKEPTAPIVINTFNTATEAMHVLDIDSSSITKVCNGTRRTAGGFCWRWA